MAGEIFQRGAGGVNYIVIDVCFRNKKNSKHSSFFLEINSELIWLTKFLSFSGSSDECVYVNGSLTKEPVPPRFGVSEYNLIMLAWLITATVSFVLLHWSPLGKEGSSEQKPTDSRPELPVDESCPLNVRFTLRF